jgi:hypothetical protein
MGFRVCCKYLLESAASAIDTECIFISTVMASERDDLGTAAGTSLVAHFDRFLVASRTEPPLDRIEVFFFLFEIVDIAEYRSDQNDQHKK